MYETYLYDALRRIIASAQAAQKHVEANDSAGVRVSLKTIKEIVIAMEKGEALKWL